MSIYTPQQLVDQLHEIHMEQIFVEGIPLKEHKEVIKLAKLKLKAVKQRLKAEEGYIKSKWDGRNRQQAVIKRVELTPYGLLDDVISQLEVRLADLEATLDFGGSVPPAPQFGTVLVGGTKYGGYILSDELGATKWLIERVTELIEHVPKPASRSSIILWSLIFLAMGIFVIYAGFQLQTSFLLFLIMGSFLGLYGLLAMFSYPTLERKYQEKLQPLKDERAELEDLYQKTQKELFPTQISLAHVQEQTPQLSSVSNNTRAKFEKIKGLIQSKQYDEARALLRQIDHPKATEWLTKLDNMGV